jgi:hypothetical protein
MKEDYVDRGPFLCKEADKSYMKQAIAKKVYVGRWNAKHLHAPNMLLTGWAF